MINSGPTTNTRLPGNRIARVTFLPLGLPPRLRISNPGDTSDYWLNFTSRSFCCLHQTSFTHRRMATLLKSSRKLDVRSTLWISGESVREFKFETEIRFFEITHVPWMLA
ncbi:hypothetical protein CDAR_116201 [Caerostris darwini]|uniref:Uncharacterized protein n=1 Tax=Caerostris darwini TaxID=1538125 RepID=A0AAV4SL90_9ARAC|nr:hypothetical protein CDAR_116201 [Caerostris darwini]